MPNEKIHDVQRLIGKYLLPNGDKTKTQDRYKCRGTAIITNGTKTFMNCEIHWYQCVNIGKVYDVLAVDRGWYRIVDESEEDYLYPPTNFEVVAEDAQELKQAV